MESISGNCVNLPDNYRCECKTGFKFDEDGKCIGMIKKEFLV